MAIDYGVALVAVGVARLADVIRGLYGATLRLGLHRKVNLVIARKFYETFRTNWCINGCG